uniref:Uncharacterized protein n=1 Tax=Glossina austeni TaxID=7395 RepID=A0A1A9VY30_GLOAU
MFLKPLITPKIKIYLTGTYAIVSGNLGMVSSRFATDSGSVSSSLFLTVGDDKFNSCSSSDSVDSLISWLPEVFPEIPMDLPILNALHDPDNYWTDVLDLILLTSISIAAASSDVVLVVVL